METLSRNRGLLALCGLLEAAMSVVYFVTLGDNGPDSYHDWRGMVMMVGICALGAAVCSMAAGVLGSTYAKKSLLILNGLALGALGIIFVYLTHTRIRFLTVATLIMVMALSLGSLELLTALRLRKQSRPVFGWIAGLAGVGSVGFAAVFLALGLKWIAIQPGTHLDILWMGAYFGFNGVCMTGLALRPNLHGQLRRDLAEPVNQNGSPGLAH